MAKYRQALPQLDGDIYLCDAGLETDLIFNHGIEIREDAAHTLMEEDQGRQALSDYFRDFYHWPGIAAAASSSIPRPIKPMRTGPRT